MRIGERMGDVHMVVWNHPGCRRVDVARILQMPQSSASAAVRRAIKAGLICEGGTKFRTLYAKVKP